MRYTLLQVVQSVLSDMSGDEINSLSDLTVEAEQVVSLARDVFYYFVDEYQLPGNERVIQLEDAGVGYATILKLPDGVKRLKSLRYNCRVDNSSRALYNELTYVEPNEFLHLVTRRDNTLTEISTVNHPVTGVPMYVYNDRHPTKWSTFDDKYVLFDAHDSTLDAELQVSQTMAMVEEAPVFTIDDSFSIPLPDHLQSLYLAEVKSHCFTTLKQVDNGKVEQAARRLRYNVQSQKDRTDIRPKRPNYGRN